MGVKLERASLLHIKSKCTFVKRLIKVFVEGHGWLVSFGKHLLVGEHVKATTLAGLLLKVFPTSEAGR
jgi:hypothetical protein